jgi:ribose 5-phosphate isomerase RpiB
MCPGAGLARRWRAPALVDIYLAATFSTDADVRHRVAKLAAMEAS